MSSTPDLPDLLLARTGPHKNTPNPDTGSHGAGRHVFLKAVTTMARKPGTRAEFVLFDVFYEDGSQRSNRKVPSTALGGIDGDAPARTIIEQQDREIAEKSGLPAVPIKALHRSGAK
jgi:hypothetical protein